MRIAYLNDQIFPTHETDTEQLMSMICAMGRQGACVDLIIPKTHFQPDHTVSELARHYQDSPTFSVTSVPSAYPSTRALEKVAHPLAAFLRKRIESSDVIYTRNLPAASLALTLTDKPVVYETFRPWGDQKTILRPFLKWFIRQKRLILVITHSQLAGRSFSRLGLPDRKLLPAHNGYHPSRLEPRLSQKEARQKLGVSEPHVATYAGHVNMAKGCGLILDMAKAIPDTRFYLVGSTGRGEVEQRAKVLPNVHVIPWRKFTETLPYLYAADVLLIPPTSGPLEKVGNTVLPIKTFLYMATGRALYAPNTPDLREVLVHDRNALLVEPNRLEPNIRDLADLLHDSPRLERLGRQAQEDSLPLTWDNRAKLILKAIEERL